MTWFLFYWADADLSKCKLDNEEHPEFTELAWKVATAALIVAHCGPNAHMWSPLASHSLGRGALWSCRVCVVCRVVRQDWDFAVEHVMEAKKDVYTKLRAWAEPAIASHLASLE